jgi:hypothetical protein
MVDLLAEQSTVLLRTWDRNGCLPVCSRGSACRSFANSARNRILELFTFDRDGVRCPPSGVSRMYLVASSRGNGSWQASAGFASANAATRCNTRRKQRTLQPLCSGKKPSSVSALTAVPSVRPGMLDTQAMESDAEGANIPRKPKFQGSLGF